jgi:hypothetical protein
MEPQQSKACGAVSLTTLVSERAMINLFKSISAGAKFNKSKHAKEINLFTAAGTAFSWQHITHEQPLALRLKSE